MQWLSSHMMTWKRLPSTTAWAVWRFFFLNCPPHTVSDDKALQNDVQRTILGTKL